MVADLIAGVTSQERHEEVVTGRRKMEMSTGRRDSKDRL
jgi:hypothetical protein